MQDKNTPHVNVHDALQLDGKPETLANYYRKWSETYDKDVTDNYYGLEFICNLMHKYLIEINTCAEFRPEAVHIIDVGCGTGLLGKPLHNLGYRVLDGIDLSTDMIEKAGATNYYRNLYPGINLNESLPKKHENQYDVSLSVGVFTLGHVQPESLYQLAALTKPGGLVITSTRIPYYDSTNYKAVNDQLNTDGIANLVTQVMNAPYRDDGNAHYWVYEVL